MLEKIKSKWPWLVIGLVVVAVGFWWWQARALAKKTADQKQEYIVKPQNLTKRLVLSGTLNFGKEANLRFQTSGLLAWVGVKAGAKVKKGQAIASLDRRDLYKRLKKSLNSYYKTRLDFEENQDEYRDILDKTPTIQRLLEKTQKDLDNAVLDVELQHLAWQLAVITAPFSGVIDSLTVPIAGTNITPAKATFHLVDPDSLFFQAEVDEMDLRNISLNKTADITLDAYPDIKLTGSIAYISLTSTTGRGGSQVYLAKIPIDKKALDSFKDKPLPSGLNGQASLVLAKKDNVLAVPADFVYYQNNKPYVLLKKPNGQTAKQFIRTGLETDEYIEITNGLNQNDVITAK
ncbi:MAG: efflux RND transporter periplasmic adaptor subunit [bacterium]|nr:efflux RND transporter periplasmic adaptor subunit [bacterium]